MNLHKFQAKFSTKKARRYSLIQKYLESDLKSNCVHFSSVEIYIHSDEILFSCPDCKQKFRALNLVSVEAENLLPKIYKNVPDRFTIIIETLPDYGD